MVTTHNLGFPRIGENRELKQALESYWQGKTSQADLLATGKALRARHWQLQAEAGLDYLPVGDFASYDHVLSLSVLLGVVPARFGHVAGTPVTLDTLFRMARGQAPKGADAPACEMTKWFDTNYHYIVPEFTQNQTFTLSNNTLFEQVAEAQALGHKVKAVLVGPLTYLWLGKLTDNTDDKLALLPALIEAYQQILERLSEQGVEWVQLDEPILSLDLPAKWQGAMLSTYEILQKSPIKIMLASYFGALADNWRIIPELNVAALHIDATRDPEAIASAMKHVPEKMILSIGVINGRNIWRADLPELLSQLKPLQQKLGNRLWLAPSCSLMHVPVDLDKEVKMNPEIKQWLAFAKQKLSEVAILGKALRGESIVETRVAAELEASQKAAAARKQSPLIHNKAVQTRMASLTAAEAERQHPYDKRAQVQQKALGLPLFPTTTIGSFPQTVEIRHARRQWKAGQLPAQEYQQKMRAEIEYAVREQEKLDIDVLVHGEAERNDMVEYFGELLNGFAFTENGWVQSYGSRYVKPPIIYGDVSRPAPMTIEWISYAQSLTKRLMKGMLTGPNTILCWSFVRDDQSREQTAKQIALALRDEVTDLEAAGIKVIQIDEPAFREGLPLRHKEWAAYLEWATEAFRISSCGVKDETQIHTHMCYAEFNDIIEAIADLDADVITIETSRSHMELLKAFERFNYPNSIGPGVYDIHSPRIPDEKDIVGLLKKALTHIPAARLWINPDCGLKTRGWPEVNAALSNMVNAAKALRADMKTKATDFA